MNVMNNLKRLKGKEESFGKISITDDYTTSEREEIKRWVKKAKEKSSEDPDKIFKVRGDPQNGRAWLDSPGNISRTRQIR